MAACMRSFGICLLVHVVFAAKQIDRDVLDKAHPTVDYSDPNVPLLNVNGRVLDLVHGEHFDDILIDTPDDIRPPAVIAFHGYKTCPNGLQSINFQEAAETVLPARERLFIASYDVDAAPGRAWYKFVPERDLAKRFKVNLTASCPQLVFVPRSCNGWTEWCREGDKLGCDDYKEQCTNTVQYKGSTKEGQWKDWLMKLVKKEGVPKLSRSFDNYYKQGKWIRSRDSVSTTNVQRNIHLANKLPGFTPNGAKSVECPKELCDWLEKFYSDRADRPKQTEHWAASGTQNSFHVTKTFIHSIDEEYSTKMRLANKYMKPMMEEWSGIPNLQLTSFYGIREYHEGHWLRKHVDREETHVISATISIAKFPTGGGIVNSTGPTANDPWPLEGVNWQGENIVYPHAPRTIILYESAKFIHGRYMTNPMNTGGVHLGAFLHYAPPDDFGWKSIASQGTNAGDTMHEWITYKSTDSQEFENPDWTENRYTEHTQYDVDDVLGADGDETQPKGLQFLNLSNRPLHFVWSGESDIVDQCGEVAVGKYCRINTFNTHRFYWATDSEGQNMVGRVIEIDSTMEDNSEVKFTEQVEHEHSEL